MIGPRCDSSNSVIGIGELFSLLSAAAAPLRSITQYHSVDSVTLAAMIDESPFQHVPA